MKSNSIRVLVLICLVLFFVTNVSANKFDKQALIKARKARQLEELVQIAEHGDAESQEKLGQRYLDKGVHDQAFYWLKKASDQNLASAQFALSKFYYQGLSVEQDQEKAVALIRQSANNGYPDAQLMVGIDAARNQDFSTAAGWFQKAAEQDSVRAMEMLSNMFFKGEGVTKDLGKTFYWNKRASEAGSANATFNLGICYGKGIGVSPDGHKADELIKQAALAGHDGALQIFTKKAEAGDAEAQLIMARFFDRTDNRLASLGYYLKAARNNNPEAQSKIVDLWLAKKLEKKTDEQIERIIEEQISRLQLQEEMAGRQRVELTAEKRAEFAKMVTTAVRADEIGADEILPWIEKSASSGDANAQCRLAQIYSSVTPVTDVPTHPDKAVLWLNKGLQKNTDCSRNLAYELLGAKTISPQEQKLVVAWIKKEAEHDSLAQGKLAWHYLYGSAAISQNKKEALRIYYKKAASGDVSTQCELGNLYLSGMMLKENFVTGMAFLLPCRLWKN